MIYTGCFTKKTATTNDFQKLQIGNFLSEEARAQGSDIRF